MDYAKCALIDEIIEQTKLNMDDFILKGIDLEYMFKKDVYELNLVAKCIDNIKYWKK